ncbi:MAG: carboxy-S-adenosyl-L-methionine synthase CmoA [Desulfobulbaceae bacterium]|nr:carboxy-S-adenosyl-L-methionine synthase CmoA [Desulfobulbaceae bacterium]
MSTFAKKSGGIDVTPANRDEIFRDKPIREDFAFNGEVAAVFDDMLQRSVPCYHLVIDAMAQILDRRLANGALVYDLGCSIGTTLCLLAERLAERGFHYTGVDKAPAMLEQARRQSLTTAKGRVRFLDDDITTCPLSDAGAVLCNYTLQFLRPVARQAFVNRVFAALPPGGVFLLSEKTIGHAPSLNRDFIAIHHNFKRMRGYSELEIAAKREALENVLIPFSLQENMQLLQKAGFVEVEPFFTWFNFSSIVGLKR